MTLDELIQKFEQLKSKHPGYGKLPIIFESNDRLYEFDKISVKLYNYSDLKWAPYFGDLIIVNLDYFKK